MSTHDSQNDSIQKRSIPQERPKLKVSTQNGIIPNSMIDHQINHNNKNNKDKQDKANNNNNNINCAMYGYGSQGNMRDDKQTQPSSPTEQTHHVVIQMEEEFTSSHKCDGQIKQQNKIDEENPFNNIEFIDNEQTAVYNNAQDLKKNSTPRKTTPPKAPLNDSLGPKLVLSRFAMRKNEINLTTSIQQPFSAQGLHNKSIFQQNGNSKENEQVIYSGSQGWMHSQFNPQLDNNIKKELYVVQKMVEFQFDPVIAKGILEQIDMDKYSREELVQMVCETMLHHCVEQRIGKRVIDRIQQSRFLSKVITSSRKIETSQNITPNRAQTINNNMLTNNQNTNQPFFDIPVVPSQNFQPASSIGNSLNSNNLNIPPGNGNGNYQNSFASKKGMGRDKSPSSQKQNTKGKRGTTKINSHIFSMPITHSQKFIKIENNVPDKQESKLYECSICCEEYLGSEFYRMTNCSHNYCMNCIQFYLQEKINKSEVLNIVCPQTDCGLKLLDFQIQKVLPPESFDRYMKLKKIMVLNQDPSVRWCPTLDCETYMRGDKDKPCLECPKCSQKMCFLCNNKWHEGSCEDAMNKSLLDLKEKLQIQQCPKCKGRIQKFEGCNHMKCWICSYEFCWLCNKQYTKWHYKSWNIMGCPDMMFSDVKLEGVDKFCNTASSLLRLLFLIILMGMGGATALMIYIVLMFIFALALPFFLTYHYFKPAIEKLQPSKKYMLWLILGASSIFLYPLWLILCFVPGSCIFGPEIYMYILFIVYNEDMYG